MHLKCYRLKNFRRMADTLIDLDPEFSVFVGANNSGKTSATQAIQTFVAGRKDKITLHDFSSFLRKKMNEDAVSAEPDDLVNVPSIKLDLWFTVNQQDLFHVIPLLPSTDWEGTEIGVQIEFGPRSPSNLIANFRKAFAEAKEQREKVAAGGVSKYHPWPKCFADYLEKELGSEFEFRYYALDRAQFDDEYREKPGYKPAELKGDPTGAKLIQSMIRVDTLKAQRHLSDSSVDESSSSGRSEDLSKRLSKFYKSNLEQMQDDHQALKALAESELGLNEHLKKVFEATLARLEKLGYPGVKNPRMSIKSALNPENVLTQNARVHYIVGKDDSAVELPDTNNGLGFKNLIYMVVEILDLQARWKAQENDRPLLHLIFVEEPEAHLHTQLQQVFIRNVLELLKIKGDDPQFFKSQLVITTHSPHILYERGFKPIRYFKRKYPDEMLQSTDVLNLSNYYAASKEDGNFLQRYLKLTHCDLFFADAAVLVEGNVERLLIPAMIEKSAPKLMSACVCVLEVGGAFGYRFQSLIEFLGLTTLVVTDIDSVSKEGAGAEEDEDSRYLDAEVGDEAAGAEDTDEKGPPKKKKTHAKSCSADALGAFTANQTLLQWLPRRRTIAELWAATAEDKTAYSKDAGSKTRVTYQLPVQLKFGEQTGDVCGRTLEEMFGLENYEWCQAENNEIVGLMLRKAPPDLEALKLAMYRKVKGKGFDKTQFAIGVLTSDQADWNVPAYIAEGLLWLEEHVSADAIIDHFEEDIEKAEAAA